MKLEFGFAIASASCFRLLVLIDGDTSLAVASPDSQEQQVTGGRHTGLQRGNRERPLLPANHPTDEANLATRE